MDLARAWQSGYMNEYLYEQYRYDLDNAGEKDGGEWPCGSGSRGFGAECARMRSASGHEMSGVCKRHCCDSVVAPVYKENWK